MKNYVHVNISLPAELNEKVEQLLGKRKKSPFIAQLLEREIEILEKEQIEKELEEGYKSRTEEALEITQEFEPAIIEGIVNDDW